MINGRSLSDCTLQGSQVSRIERDTHLGLLSRDYVICCSPRSQDSEEKNNNNLNNRDFNIRDYDLITQAALLLGVKFDLQHF